MEIGVLEWVIPFFSGIAVIAIPYLLLRRSRRKDNIRTELALNRYRARANDLGKLQNMLANFAKHCGEEDHSREYNVLKAWVLKNECEEMLNFCESNLTEDDSDISMEILEMYITELYFWPMKAGGVRTVKVTLCYEDHRKSVFKYSKPHESIAYYLDNMIKKTRRKIERRLKGRGFKV